MTIRPYKLVIQVIVQKLDDNDVVVADGPLIGEDKKIIVSEVMFTQAHDWIDALPDRVADVTGA